MPSRCTSCRSGSSPIASTPRPTTRRRPSTRPGAGRSGPCWPRPTAPKAAWRSARTRAFSGCSCLRANRLPDRLNPRVATGCNWPRAKPTPATAAWWRVTRSATPTSPASCALPAPAMVLPMSWCLTCRVEAGGVAYDDYLQDIVAVHQNDRCHTDDSDHEHCSNGGGQISFEVTVRVVAVAPWTDVKCTEQSSVHHQVRPEVCNAKQERSHQVVAVGEKEVKRVGAPEGFAMWPGACGFGDPPLEQVRADAGAIRITRNGDPFDIVSVWTRVGLQVLP